jgi:hypothetical protein
MEYMNYSITHGIHEKQNQESYSTQIEKERDISEPYMLATKNNSLQ